MEKLIHQNSPLYWTFFYSRFSSIGVAISRLFLIFYFSQPFLLLPYSFYANGKNTKNIKIHSSILICLLFYSLEQQSAGFSDLLLFLVTFLFFPYSFYINGNTQSSTLAPILTTLLYFLLLDQQLEGFFSALLLFLVILLFFPYSFYTNGNTKEIKIHLSFGHFSIRFAKGTVISGLFLIFFCFL